MQSLRNRLYYRLKPYLPRNLRLQVRRFFARRTRQRHLSTWPIDANTSAPPPGWKGWPDEKSFALVLTHDVEGPLGLANCQRLAETEMSLGFRSSFNFIPEGPYRVSADLRTWLTNHGFEVGVHDLRHDGHLYHSRNRFRHNATRINHYLREWNAVGFRSGFMLHNRDWLMDLEADYDASTFDTDPFEPQPDAVSTIFPFWVPATAEHQPTKGSHAPPPSTGSTALPLVRPTAGNSGYVELPYTLPQDSTLFLILQEPDDRIWRTKLDWIARHGGMALINVHPDYLDQGADTKGDPTTILDHYRNFLRYASQQHSARCWHRLPREVAHLVRSRLLPVPSAMEERP